MLSHVSDHTNRDRPQSLLAARYFLYLINNIGKSCSLTHTTVLFLASSSCSTPPAFCSPRPTPTFRRLSTNALIKATDTSRPSRNLDSLALRSGTCMKITAGLAPAFSMPEEPLCLEPEAPVVFEVESVELEVKVCL